MDRLLTRDSPYAVHLIATGLVLFTVLCLKTFFFPTRPVSPPHQSAVEDEEAAQVLIIGPVGSGKTRLWSELASGTEQQIHTWTCTGESRATLDLHRPAAAADNELKTTRDPSPPPLVLLNTPGHPSLTCPSLARNLPSAAALVFVIDSQFGLSGQGLRDTSECAPICSTLAPPAYRQKCSSGLPTPTRRALQLVLSFLQLLAYQRPTKPVPRLSIYLSNPSRKPVEERSPPDVVLQKTRAALSKELNRRRIGSTAASDASPTIGEDQLDCAETISSAGFSRSFGFLRHLLPFGLASAAARAQNGRIVALPEEEQELLRLLDQEGDPSIGADSNLSPLDRYEKFSGNLVHWAIEPHEELDQRRLSDHPVLQWLKEL